MSGLTPVFEVASARVELKSRILDPRRNELGLHGPQIVEDRMALGQLAAFVVPNREIRSGAAFKGGWALKIVKPSSGGNVNDGAPKHGKHERDEPYPSVRVPNQRRIP
jgi:hypothetical protein